MTPAAEMLAMSLALGLLVGLQRQRSASEIGGIRTFPLITVLGTVMALLVEKAGAWPLTAGFVSVTALMVTANLMRSRLGRASPGTTTEAAALLMYAVGAFLVLGSTTAAIAVGVGVAVLLNAKDALHEFSAKLGEHDVRAIMRFALMSFIILPLVPNRAFGAYGVLNPYQIWLMVVLVVGIGLAAYIAYKFIGGRTGLLVSSLLGGVISSTATTVGAARLAGAEPARAGIALVMVLVANAVLFVRLIVEVFVVGGSAAPVIAAPIAAMGVAAAVLAAAAWRRSDRPGAGVTEQRNPAEIKHALMFGAVYALVLLASAAAREHLGDKGLYAVAALSGLTDMDAVTLSSSRMASQGLIQPETAWRAVIIGVISNMVFKLGVVVLLGGTGLAKRVGIAFAVLAVVGGVMMWVW